MFGRIAAKEDVTIEPAALEQIARAADGSVRDGLSMLDQAIAQAEGAITAAQVVDMLGLADREAVFDLMDAVMGGKPAAALAITDRAYERGADLGVMLQDLLELLHTVTRLKSVPGLRDSQELPEAERTRGAALADRLSVPVLARAWQMLLKGVGEVEIAPDRRAAAEMVLIRLCHVADLPPPGDLVRRLDRRAAAAPAAPGAAQLPQCGGGGGGSRAVANGGAPMSRPNRRSGRRLGCSNVPRRRRAGGGAARGDAARASAALRASGAVRPAGDRTAPAAGGAARPGIPAGRAADRGDRHPLDDRLVRREPASRRWPNRATPPTPRAGRPRPITRWCARSWRHFPGARIDTVHDKTADAYGLPMQPPPDMPEFAPPDAEYFDEEPMEIDP